MTNLRPALAARRGRTAPLAVLCGTLLLAGCGAPPWQDTGAGFRPLATSASTPAQSPASSPSAPAAPTVANDLATGSAEHVLNAGAATLTARYWSSRDLGDWTAQSVKPLTIAISGTGTARVDLDAVVLGVESLTADGWAAVPTEAITPPMPSDAPADITAPSSASLTVLVAGIDPDATALRFTFVYSVSVGSDTAQADAVGNDTLVVPLAGKASTSSRPSPISSDS